MEEKIAPHVDEIIRALGTTDTVIDREIIQSEMARLLEFKVPPNEAKRSLLKKYGVGDVPEVKKLADLSGGERNIEITVRILDVNLKVVGIKGQERTIFMGTIADETGARSFTAWEDFEIKSGDVIKVSNAYIRIWQGVPEINFGPRSKVEKLDPDAMESLSSEDLNKPVLLANLEEGAAAVRTIFRILESGQQEITTRNGPKTIISGVAADASAKLPFTSWVHNPELTAGATVEVENAYVKSWRGVPTINMGEFTTVRESGISIGDDDIAGILAPLPMQLDRVTGRDGAFDICIEGVIISVRPGSGLITRCGKCNRVIQKDVCRVHGAVETRYDMRIKSILDDGTDALTVVMDAELTQKVTGYSIEKAQEVAAAAMNPTAVEEEIRRKLMGLTMRFRGNMSKGEYGITLVAADAQVSGFDTATAAAALIEEMENAAHSRREDAV